MTENEKENASIFDPIFQSGNESQRKTMPQI